MFEPMPAPSPPPAPSPATAPSPRFVYLVTRLRTRQITMEEATELFSIQQSMIRSAQAALPAPAIPPASSSTLTQYGTQPAGPGLVMSEDTLWTGLLLFGAGAGVLAAVLRRARGEPPAGPGGRSR